MFWIVLAGLWKGWRRALVQVHPDTVVRWQRQRFCRYWAQLSCKPRRKVGRPSISKPIRSLIQAMARTNSLWRAPRIHGELLKLGIKISERTVSRILRTVKRLPSQTWKTFLQNHLGEIVAIDFFTVPTVRMRVLFVFIVLEHQRRKVLHLGGTEHPTSEWVGQQHAHGETVNKPARSLAADSFLGKAAAPQPSDYHSGSLAEAGGNIEQLGEMLAGRQADLIVVGREPTGLLEYRREVGLGDVGRSLIVHVTSSFPESLNLPGGFFTAPPPAATSLHLALCSEGAQ